MHQILNKIRDIDYLLFRELENSEINPEEILRLVDIRKQAMENVVELLAQRPELTQSSECQSAIARTTDIVARMKLETSLLGKDLHQFKMGQRSLQHYKRFT